MRLKKALGAKSATLASEKPFLGREMAILRRNPRFQGWEGFGRGNAHFSAQSCGSGNATVRRLEKLRLGPGSATLRLKRPVLGLGRLRPASKPAISRLEKKKTAFGDKRASFGVNNPRVGAKPLEFGLKTFSLGAEKPHSGAKPAAGGTPRFGGRKGNFGAKPLVLAEKSGCYLKRGTGGGGAKPLFWGQNPLFRGRSICKEAGHKNRAISAFKISSVEGFERKLLFWDLIRRFWGFNALLSLQGENS